MNDRYRCPLGTLQPSSFNAEQVKREGWQEQGVLVVPLSDERLNWVQREQVKQLGEYLYGKKSGANGNG